MDHSTPLETKAPRIAPGTLREIGAINTTIAKGLGLAAGTQPPNIFTTLAKHRGLFRRWLWFAAGLMPGGRLPRAETEMLILRVAHLCGCEYEWSHHARLGRKAGLSPSDIEALRAPTDAYPWSPRRLALLRAADDLHAHRRIGDAPWAALRAVLDEVEAIELCMLVGHYEMLAMTLNSLDVRPDLPR
jgi:AhpD family alkylhydroperoxidase